MFNYSKRKEKKHMNQQAKMPPPHSSNGVKNVYII